MKTTAFLIENLSRHYDGAAAPVLDGVNLEVRWGEIVLLTGPSGTGKTTLLNLIAGLDCPDGGEIEVAGQDLNRLPEHKLARLRGKIVGIVLQHYFLARGLTAQEAVAAPLLWNLVLSPPEALQRARSQLENLGFGEAERLRRVEKLSGGQRQRVALARALAPSPSLLLADEPTSQLDEDSAARVQEAIRDWMLSRQKEKKPTALVLVSHEKIARELGETRRLLLKDGKLTEQAASV